MWFDHTQKVRFESLKSVRELTKQTCGESIPERRKGQSECLQLRVHLECFQNSKEPMWLREKTVRRVGLLRRLHRLSFTTLYLLSPLPWEAGRETTEKTTKRDIKDCGHHHAPHCYPTFIEYLKLGKVGKALTTKL